MNDNIGALTHKNIIVKLRTGRIVDSYEAVEDKIVLEAFARGQFHP